MKIQNISFKNKGIIYAVLCSFLFIVVMQFVDLPFIFGNWENKAKSILNFDLTDNYYPPGAAIALIPFLWNKPNFVLGIVFYYFIAAYVYFKICAKIRDRKLKFFALLALPSNAYLSWLCITSAEIGRAHV